MNKGLSKNELIINTLLIKQIKLLPSPIQLRNQLKTPFTASEKSRKRFNSNISAKIPSIPSLDQNSAKTTIITKKNIDIPKEQEGKDGKSRKNSKILVENGCHFTRNDDKNSQFLSENCDKNSHILQENGEICDNSLGFIANFNDKIFHKKSFKSSLIMKKNHSEDAEDQEIYEQKPDFDDIPIEKMEKRINEFLDSENIVLRDPLEKKDEFYQRKKNLVIKKSSHKSYNSSPGKQEEDITDCNSPGLNLSINSGLLMKRKMKSTTVVLEAKPEKILSKFSGN